MRQLLTIAIGVTLAFAAPARAVTPGGESVDDANVATLRLLLEQPEGHIDLAKAKVTIDRMVDPDMDGDGTLQSLDEWTARVRSRFPPGASNKVKVEVLVSTLYEPGPWNDHRPFAYDFTDPYGGNLRNTLLRTMLASRTGQCVSMPIAFVLLGQKLRLPLTMTTAPYHLLAKYGDEETGQWMNLEATSGKFHYDSGYEHSLRIPPEAIRQQTFLRPCTQRESVALFATATLVPFYRQNKQPERMLQVTELILEANPRDAVAMTLRGDAYYLMIEQHFKSRYPLAEQIPLTEQEEFKSYSRQNLEWYAKAEALGWREWSDTDWADYLEHFARQKSKQQGVR